MTRGATSRFSNRVDDYVRARPRYPAGVIDVLRDGLGLAPDWAVADVGSGTGISSLPFLDNGNIVFAVEPNDAMRAAAEAALGDRSGFRSVKGTAEATTLEGASVDLVVAGQAFHWFDRAAARAEWLRILRRPARVALLWNTRDTETTPFLRAYEQLLHEHGTDYAAVRHDRIDGAALETFFGGRCERRSLENAQSLDRDGLRARLLSTSYVPAAGEPGSDAMLARLDTLFDAHARDGRVVLAYDVDIVYGTLADGAG